MKMQVTKRSGERIEFESDLSDERAAEIVRQNTTDSFSVSLMSQLRRSGRLSESQWAWVHKLATERLAKDKPQVVEQLGDLSGVAKLFATAAAKLKYPKITLLVHDQKIVLKLCTSGSKYAGDVHVTAGAYGSDYFGRITRDGSFVVGRACTDTVRDFLRELSVDPVRIAREYGRRTGHCCFCTKELTDERSVLVGYGPICADNFGLPWGEQSRAQAREQLQPRRELSRAAAAIANRCDPNDGDREIIEEEIDATA